MSYLERARELKEEMITHRRYLHKNAEVGYKLPVTTAYVMEELKKMGYEPEEICESGVVVTVGNGGKCFLLRSDMDALPMEEMSGLDFASDHLAAHCCGHDLHTATLLGAAKMLKEKESELDGTVKLMFQPAEEIFWGAEAMINAGVMENPKVDVAFASHVNTTVPTGTVTVCEGAAMASCYGFRITITGKGCHGAQPQTGIDPINIGVHIHLALQELIAREVTFQKGAILTIGSFNAGAAANIIPHTAVMQGTLRTFDGEVRKYLIGRIQEVVTKTAELYRGSVEIETLSNPPVMLNNLDFCKTMRGYMTDMFQGQYDIIDYAAQTGSEDFACVAQMVPAMMIFIGAADPNSDEEVFALHHPKVKFDEDVLPVSAAIYCELATRWLRENK